jgi:hypothetical protein
MELNPGTFSVEFAKEWIFKVENTHTGKVCSSYDRRNCGECD